MIDVEVGQVLFVYAGGLDSFNLVRVVGVFMDCSEEEDPKGYMRVVVRGIDTPSDDNRVFYPEDFGRVIYTSQMIVDCCFI